jgi:hypothetical protein
MKARFPIPPLRHAVLLLLLSIGFLCRHTQGAATLLPAHPIPQETLEALSTLPIADATGKLHTWEQAAQNSLTPPGVPPNILKIPSQRSPLSLAVQFAFRPEITAAAPLFETPPEICLALGILPPDSGRPLSLTQLTPHMARLRQLLSLPPNAASPLPNRARTQGQTLLALVENCGHWQTLIYRDGKVSRLAFDLTEALASTPPQPTDPVSEAINSPTGNPLRIIPPSPRTPQWLSLPDAAAIGIQQGMVSPAVMAYAELSESLLSSTPDPAFMRSTLDSLHLMLAENAAFTDPRGPPLPRNQPARGTLARTLRFLSMALAAASLLLLPLIWKRSHKTSTTARILLFAAILSKCAAILLNTPLPTPALWLDPLSSLHLWLLFWMLPNPKHDPRLRIRDNLPCAAVLLFAWPQGLPLPYDRLNLPEIFAIVTLQNSLILACALSLRTWLQLYLETPPSDHSPQWRLYRAGIDLQTRLSLLASATSALLLSLLIQTSPPLSAMPPAVLLLISAALLSHAIQLQLKWVNQLSPQKLHQNLLITNALLATAALHLPQLHHALLLPALRGPSAPAITMLLLPIACILPPLIRFLRAQIQHHRHPAPKPAKASPRSKR